jgi:hypothetical protein
LAPSAPPANEVPAARLAGKRVLQFGFWLAEYFIFLSACIGLTLSLIGLWLWLDHQRRGQKMIQN